MWFSSEFRIYFHFLKVVAGNKGGVEEHLEMGKKLLAAGQLADALSHYHAAVGKFISEIFYTGVL